MELEGWAQYTPPPGSRYRVHYAADDHSETPDIATLSRALDARPSVAVKSLEKEGVNGFVADVIIYVGDVTLLTVLGPFLCAGPCWRIQSVERTDDGALNGVSVTVGKVFDAILDPVQDIGSAASETVKETASTVRKVGVPSVAIVAVAMLGFLVAREL